MATLMMLMAEPLYYENHIPHARSSVLLLAKSLSFKRLSLQPSEV
jgi:hypothetical protein